MYMVDCGGGINEKEQGTGKDRDGILMKTAQ
jgi:hypothetical protein